MLFPRVLIVGWLDGSATHWASVQRIGRQRKALNDQATGGF
jgi:hypothetical protein